MGYELARALLVGQVRRAMRLGAIRFVRQHRVQLELARFVDRVWMRERLASDRQVEAAILDANQRTGKPIPKLREQVDAYVDEIAPYFSISTYYQLGAGIARRFVGFCFEMVVDEAAFERQSLKVPEGAVRVYVINHRSNFDPLVLAYGLMRQIALSYAVGEWALVWPLSSLFRAFGSFFVRRGEPDPLYHVVLERFVQLLAGQGAVTGFFPEGGLTRDGALRKPRSGLLEYIIKLRIEHPDREIVFLPVGLNYDRVLEDRWLAGEAKGRPAKPMFVIRLFNLLALLIWLPILIAANVLRYASFAPPKFGVAAIAFGEPLRLSDWPGGSQIHELPADERKEAVKSLATELLYRRIGHAIPVVPVAIACTALLRPGGDGFPEIVKRIKAAIAEFREAGAPVSLPASFDAIRDRKLQRPASQIPDLDDDVDDGDEAEQVLMLAVAQLARRRVIRVHRTPRRIEVLDTAVVEYYANSVRHHLDAAHLDARDAAVAG